VRTVGFPRRDVFHENSAGNLEPDKIRWLSGGFKGLSLPVEAVNPAQCAEAEEPRHLRGKRRKKSAGLGFLPDAIVVAEDSGCFWTASAVFPAPTPPLGTRKRPGSARLCCLKKLAGNPTGGPGLSAPCAFCSRTRKGAVRGTLEGRVAQSARGDPSRLRRDL
jgi:hypothetical protein